MPNPALKLQQIGLLWFLALGLSAALVSAGRRWPDSLTPGSGPIWTLLLLPPVAMALWLLGRWTLPDPGQEGESELSPHEQQ